MSRAFNDTTFTPSINAAQELYGSRANNRHFELADVPGNGSTESEIKFT
ncbi:MAG TPA: hypothetical protein VGE32_13185 [Cellvibrio sp.]